MWWPESLEEVLFVTSKYTSSRKFHVGYRAYAADSGFVAADNSFSEGLFGYTSDAATGATKIPAANDYMSAEKCVVLDLDSAEEGLEVASPCPVDAKAVCKSPIG